MNSSTFTATPKDAGINIGIINTAKMTRPMTTAIATSMRVIIPEGMSAANVPPKMSAAAKITPQNS